MKKVIALALIAISLNASAQTDSTKPNKRPIDKVKVWQNGVVYDADDIDVVCVWDDLATTARFYYTLQDSTGAVVSSGNVELTGDDYKDYSVKANHADRAVIMVMRKLNVKERAARAAIQALKPKTTQVLPTEQ
jgi:hypothetical protein